MTISGVENNSICFYNALNTLDNSAKKTDLLEQPVLSNDIFVANNELTSDADDMLDLLLDSSKEVGEVQEDLIPAYLAWQIFAAVAGYATRAAAVSGARYMAGFVTRSAVLNIRTVASNSGNQIIRDAVRRYNAKVMNHLKKDDLEGAVKDIFGKPILKNGREWNHADEVKNAIDGITRQINVLKNNNGIRNSRNPADRAEAARLLRTMSTEKDRLVNFIQKAIDKSGRR